jgi:cation-transporting ATPase 13A2
VLISGEVYVNEASLTGENIPIGKFPALAAANLYEDNCWLFEGAKVLELRGNPTALVVNTGFSTRKGRIFRKILHNNPTAPEFMLSAIKFLAIMFLCAYIIYFGFVAFMLQHQLSPTAIFYRALDLIGWAAPAAFPIFFNLCYSVGLSRLRSSKIYGT